MISRSFPKKYLDKEIQEFNHDGWYVSKGCVEKNGYIVLTSIYVGCGLKKLDQKSVVEKIKRSMKKDTATIKCLTVLENSPAEAEENLEKVTKTFLKVFPG